MFLYFYDPVLNISIELVFVTTGNIKPYDAAQVIYKLQVVFLLRITSHDSLYIWISGHKVDDPLLKIRLVKTIKEYLEKSMFFTDDTD